MALIELITGDRTDAEDDEPVRIEIEDAESDSGGRRLGRTLLLGLLAAAVAVGLAYYVRRGGDRTEMEFAEIELDESSEAAETDAE
jgi:hypothetical protein